MKLLRNLAKIVLTIERPLGYNAFAQRRELAVVTDAEASKDKTLTRGQGGRKRRIKSSKTNGR